MLAPLHMENSEYDKKYLPGFWNRTIRYYYYLEQGLNILNEFRNLFLGILGIYIALHLTNIVWMVIMFIPSIMVLTVAGYYSVHRISKVREWLNIRFGTHYGVTAFNFQREQNELLKEILKEVKKR